MGIPFAIVLVVGAIAAVAVFTAVRAGKARLGDGHASGVPTPPGHGMPHAGEPAPRRDGLPVPGSEPERNLHGKP